MKYRIIKRLNGDGDEYYLVQHYDNMNLNWNTMQGFVVGSYFPGAEDKKFNSLKEAKKYIKSVIKKDKNLNTPATVVYEEEIE